MAALSALRTDVRLKLHDSNSRILTDAQANSLLNQAQDEWCHRVEEIRQENAYAVTALQFDYAAPSDMIKLISANWRPRAGNPLDVVSRQEFEAMGGLGYGTVGSPKMILVEGKNAAYRFRLWPAPSATSVTTTLDGAHNDTVTTIEVASADSFRSPWGWVGINSEKILYQNKSDTNDNLLLCRRAMGGTTAASHSNGDTVTQLDLFVVYSRRPATLSADADIPEIDAQYHLFLSDYVMWRAFELDGRTTEASKAKSVWEEHIRTGLRAVRRKQGASPSVVAPHD